MNIKLTFLGTGSISSLSNHSSMFINNDTLIDCGNGIYKALLNNKIDLTKIRYILITHLHIDHIFDIPLILFGIHKINPNQKITFIGNKDLKKTVNLLMKLGHPFSYKKILNELNICFIRNDHLKNFKLENGIEVESFHVIHGNLKDCYGYILNKIIAFTGDTSYSKIIREVARRVKYLVSDATLKIGNHAHMGVDNIKDLSNNNPKLKIITTHMGIESRKLLKKTFFKNNNVIIAEDKDIFQILDR